MPARLSACFNLDQEEETDPVRRTAILSVFPAKEEGQLHRLISCNP